MKSLIFVLKEWRVAIQKPDGQKRLDSSFSIVF